jgi:hypothetical protein
MKAELIVLGLRSRGHGSEQRRAVENSKAPDVAGCRVRRCVVNRASKALTPPPPGPRPFLSIADGRAEVGRSPRAWRLLRCGATNQRPPHPPKPVAVRCCSLLVLVSVNVMVGQVGNSACAVRGISVATVHASAPPVHSAPTAVIATIDRGRGARPLSILCTNRLQKGQAAS